MIGILGGMGTQAGLDFCNKLAMINRGKIDQKYPLFILYNKSNIPKRPENLKKYYNVLNSLVAGCRLLQKNKCRFIPIDSEHFSIWSTIKNNQNNDIEEIILTASGGPFLMRFCR